MADDSDLELSPTARTAGPNPFQPGSPAGVQLTVGDLNMLITQLTAATQAASAAAQAAIVASSSSSARAPSAVTGKDLSKVLKPPEKFDPNTKDSRTSCATQSRRCRTHLPSCEPLSGERLCNRFNACERLKQPRVWKLLPHAACPHRATRLAWTCRVAGTQRSSKATGSNYVQMLLQAAGCASPALTDPARRPHALHVRIPPREPCAPHAAPVRIARVRAGT